ncbi:winged helix DNA-binding domain-containing protein [Saccharopolyspora sp. ASAGF58]|nr:winged helix DNA-binding domain-containing protein [Saccharopolyspora sp. ASAGF58]
MTAKRHPGLDMTPERDTATNELISTYFDRYGPATLRDAMWWSGLSRTAILSAMTEARDEWVRVLAPWSPSPMFMPHRRWEEFQASTPEQSSSGLNFWPTRTWRSKPTSRPGAAISVRYLHGRRSTRSARYFPRSSGTARLSARGRGKEPPRPLRTPSHDAEPLRSSGRQSQTTRRC